MADSVKKEKASNRPEMGHVKNYQSKGFGKLLQAMRHPLVKKIAIATALLGVILPSSKKDEKDNEKTVMDFRKKSYGTGRNSNETDGEKTIMDETDNSGGDKTVEIGTIKL